MYIYIYRHFRSFQLSLVLAEVRIKKLNMLNGRKCDVPTLSLVCFVVLLMYHIVKFYDLFL